MKRAKVIGLVLCLLLVAAVSSAQVFETEPLPYPVAPPDYSYFIGFGNTGYYLLTGSVIGEFSRFVKATYFFRRYGIKHIVIYLNSPGGSFFDGLSFAQLMLELQSRGVTIEVRCYGIAASAAAVILAAGSPGHRWIADCSFVMVHELLVFKFLSTQSVSQVEKEAKVMRKLQNAMIQMLASRIKLSPEELKKRCAEETWISAQQAVEWGFADHLIK